jgi:DNA-binding NtrC family response regulator
VSILPHILILSSDLKARVDLAKILERLGFAPITASTVNKCREILAKENVGLVFCDRDLADGDYRDVVTLAACKFAKGKARVVLTCRLAEPDEYQEAKLFGVFDVIVTPCRPADVEWMVILARRDAYKRDLAGIGPRNTTLAFKAGILR